MCWDAGAGSYCQLIHVAVSACTDRMPWLSADVAERAIIAPASSRVEAIPVELCTLEGVLNGDILANVLSKRNFAGPWRPKLCPCLLKPSLHAFPRYSSLEADELYESADESEVDAGWTFVSLAGNCYYSGVSRRALVHVLLVEQGRHALPLAHR